ncbi:MAG TPA: choice-of-anchor J domain-containing protein [Ignavibacteria bacterium]|nr:choice-of-anchor J domain-containing protein [Ignavibacteria bacterium]
MKKNFSFLVVFAFLVTSLLVGFTLSNINDEKPAQRNSKVITTSQNDLTPVTKDQDYRKRNPFVETPQYSNDGNPNYSQASLSESFEGATFPPTGWTKLNPDAGPGWNRQTAGTTPIPGWNGGDITTPVGGGSAVAFCTWTTGGAVSNDQWLITPQLTGVLSTDVLKFSLRYWPNTFRDSIEVLLSTTGNTIPNFTNLIFRKNFAVATTIDTGWINYSFPLSAFAGQNVYIAFREVVADNFNDGASFSLDLVSVGTGSANDIATTSINAPLSVTLPTPTIAPKATYSNVGSAAQTNIPVTFKITGPVNYTSNKVIASLGVGASVTVTFDSTFNPTAGTYNNTVYCSLGSDVNRANDTLKNSFNAVDPNYGTQNGISFANSYATSAPSMPTFCWKDTTGSTSIAVNRVNVSSAPLTGTLDDGYWRIGNALNGKKIRMGGVSYDSFFVATNGMVGFAANSGLTSFTPSLVSTVRPAIYPLWMDMDWRPPTTGGLGSSRLSYKVLDDYQLLISFDRAQEYNAGTADTGDHVSYQVVVELMDAGATTNSRMVVQIADTVGQKTGSKFLGYYNTNLLNAHVMGVQTAAGDASYYRAAYPLTTYPGPLFGPGGASLAVEYGNNPNILNQGCGGVTLTFNGSIEAMTPSNVGDTVTVQLRSTTSPYEVKDASKKYMNGAGNASFTFSKIPTGTYYIAVRHRNALQTWSAAGVPVAGGLMSYNFKTGIAKAFGSNMVVVSGQASFYSGDVNQDNVIDVTDLGDVDNDANNFISGYVNTDVNNDLAVDVTDAAYVDNNAFNFVGAVIP